MTTTVRSVRVELEMGIASYVANARIAGHETDKAFGGAEKRISATSQAVSRLERNTANLARTSTDARVQQSGFTRDVEAAGAATERTARKTKAYTLEAAIADEKTARLRKSLREQAAAAVDAENGIQKVGNEIEKTGTKAGRAERSIDKYSGRLATIAGLALTLGPALIRLSAGALPAATAGIAGIGAAAAGIGVAVLAVHGLSDALKALDTYQLQPTAENLQKLRIEEEKLGPAGTQFLHYLDALEPQLRAIQGLARAGLFPGVEDGIHSLLTRLPLVRQTVNRVSQELGRLASDAGAALASDEWTPFFTYVRNEAAPILDAFARSTGNVALGLANILVAFDPLPRGFTAGLEDMTSRFAEWSKHLESDKGFQEFLDTVRQAGPELLHFGGSLVDLFTGVLRASAPLGEVTLPILTGIVKVLASIANSDAGPALYSAAAGLIVLNKAASSKAITSLSTAFLDLRTSPDRAATAIQRFGGVAKAAAGAAGMGLFIHSLSETDKSLGALEGAAGGALAGFSVGGPWGAAIGGAIGLVVSLGHAHEQTSQDVEAFTATLDAQTGALTQNSRALAVKQLADSGALEAAKSLGLNLQTVTDAALGNEDALTRLNAALSAYDQAQHAALGTRAVAGNAEVASAVNKVRDAVEGTSSAVEASQAAFDQQASAMGGATHRTNELRAAYDQTSTAVSDLESQLTELDNFLNRRGTFRAYEASLDALRASLKEAPHDFSRFSDAGRTNLENLDRTISTTEDHLKAITNPDPQKQAQSRVSYLAGVIKDLRGIAKTSPEAAAAVHDILPELQKVQAANKAVLIKANNADVMKKAAEASEALHDLATSKNRPTITANNAPAVHTIAGTKGMLDDLDGTTAHPHINVDPGNSFGILGGIRSELARIVSKTITVTVNRVGSALPHFSDGGTVPGPRMPYRDKVLIGAAPGEEIISNSHGQADRFRADRAAGRIPAYANGGTVEDRIRGTYTTRTRGSSSPYADGGPFTAINDAATQVGHAADGAASALKKLQTAADKVQASYDKEKAKLDDLISQRSSIASSIAGAAVHDPFGNGLAGFDAQVSADTGDIEAMTAALATLVANGLDPKSALYQELAAHMDVNTAQQLAALSAGDLASRATAFQHRADEAAVLGGTVAGQALNSAIAEQTKTNRELQGTLKDLQHEIHSIGEQVRRGAHSGAESGSRQGAAAGAEAGTRAGQEDKSWRTAAGVRTGGGHR